MIRTRPLKNHRTKVTFTLPATPDLSHVSVVGEFNDWDPHDLPMKRLKDERFQAREWMYWDFDRLAAPIYRSRGIRLGFRSAPQAGAVI